VFHLNQENYYVVPEWNSVPWLRHGFGTASAAPPAGDLATVKQVHSADVLIAERAGVLGTGDALVSDVCGLSVGVKTADCLPILVVDFNRRVVASIHAGWRGTAARIVTHAIRAMEERFGASAANMEAAVGPGIGLCCFEVGPEVAREFGPWESEEKTCLDLVRINRSQLEQTGIKTIHEVGLCTKCGEGFYSFRRDREQAGRMISFVGLSGRSGERTGSV